MTSKDSRVIYDHLTQKVTVYYDGKKEELPNKYESQNEGDKAGLKYIEKNVEQNL